MKKIPTYVLLVISFLLVACDTNDKAISKNDANVSKQESKSIEIPLVTTNPLDELDLSLYTNDGYTILGSHTWMENKIPTGIVVLGKQGEECHVCRGKIYAIAFQYSPEEESGKKWKIKNETRFEELGSGGKPADGVIFLKLGINNFGFATFTKEYSQGYCGEFISIYALVNSNFSMVGHFDTLIVNGEENEEGYVGSMEHDETTAEIFMDLNMSKSFYNIKVKNKIFKPRKLTSTKPAKEWEEIYIFKNGEYVSTK